jgi:hypothetical protein
MLTPTSNGFRLVKATALIALVLTIFPIIHVLWMAIDPIADIRSIPDHRKKLELFFGCMDVISYFFSFLVDAYVNISMVASSLRPTINATQEQRNSHVIRQQRKSRHILTCRNRLIFFCAMIVIFDVTALVSYYGIILVNGFINVSVSNIIMSWYALRFYISLSILDLVRKTAMKSTSTRHEASSRVTELSSVQHPSLSNQKGAEISMIYPSFITSSGIELDNY